MSNVLKQLDQVLQSRLNGSDSTSYTAQLYQKGVDGIAKKVIEEAGEVILAAKSLQYTSTDENEQHLVYETADLWFHSLVLLKQAGLDYQQVLDELQRRFGQSGLEEKANRS